VIYSVRHTTTFLYEPGIRESVMEVRVQPRTDARQRCLSFHLEVDPSANIMLYRDFLGNTVHHFDIAGTHPQIKIAAQAVVDLNPAPLPCSANAGDWQELDALIEAEDHWEMLLPSQFAHRTDELDRLARELHLERRGNPLDLLMELNEAIYQKFAYVPNSTKVDSPIDEALQSRQGVCQDFAHIMIALVRQLRIPCRYVSGYLCPGSTNLDRSPETATHAWVEVLIPKYGWIAFDPTNNLIGGERHIQIAIGRDYADVPPTRGVYKGQTTSKLGVVVTVTQSDAPSEDRAPIMVTWSRPTQASPAKSQYEQQQQQQQ
jgi:transglutaminase-like putative cysteine protease